MVVHRNALAVCIAASAIFAAPASAEIIMGFPQHETLKGQMAVASYNWQRAAPNLARICTGAGGGGRFTVVKPVDDASPALAEALKTKKGAVVQIDDDTKADGKRVAFQFNDAVIGAIKPASEGDKAMELIEFNYKSIQWLTVGCDPPAQRPRAGRGDVGGAPAASGGGYGAY